LIISAHFRDPLSVYNSGGWVVDTADTEPAHGGAIVLADEELNVVSVRMFNEAKNQGKLQSKWRQWMVAKTAFTST
jgi:hypothetical protein